MTTSDHDLAIASAWIVTGPTSGIGYRTALRLAAHGTVVLVGRDPVKLEKVRHEIESKGGSAVSIVSDLSDITSARRAAKDIAGLGLTISGLLNNVGIMPATTSRSKQGWDLAFATNHLGPLAFTDTLIPSMPDGSNVVFVCSSAEDPESTIAIRSGFRGSRYISAEASARSDYYSGGSTTPGADAYATSKQGNLAAVFSMAREIPRLRFRAVEPGFNPGSSLSRDLPAGLRIMTRALSFIAPIVPALNTPTRAAQTLTKILTDESNSTGTYYDGHGKPMRASRQVADPKYSDRYLAESRALLHDIA